MVRILIDTLSGTQDAGSIDLVPVEVSFDYFDAVMPAIHYRNTLAVAHRVACSYCNTQYSSSRNCMIVATVYCRGLRSYVA